MSYLPAQMGEEEITKLVKEAISQTGANIDGRHGKS